MEDAPTAGALLVPASAALVPPAPARPAGKESVRRGIFRRRTSPRPEINSGKVAGNNTGARSVDWKFYYHYGDGERFPRTKEDEVPRNGASEENGSPSGANGPSFMVDGRPSTPLRSTLPGSR